MKKIKEVFCQKGAAIMQDDAFWKKLIVRISVLGAICILIPLFYYSSYNFMCMDDYSVGADSHLAWVHRAGFFSGIRDIFISTARTLETLYMTLGGNYTTIIFSSLNPVIFHEKFAICNAYILLGIFIVCNFYFFKKLFYQYFLFSKQTVALMLSGLLILSTQWLPSAVEAFYWFNGSFYNIAGYSLGLVLLANLYEIAYGPGGHKRKTLYMKTVFVSIIIAGSNYTTIMYLLLTGFLFLLYMLYNKCIAKHIKVYIVLYGIFMIFCFVNILAPGNTVRQGTFERMSMTASIFHALSIGRKMYLQAINARMLIFFIVLLPFLLMDLKKISFSFSYPLVFSTILYLLYSSMFTPTLCAMYSIGPGRTQNVYYWAAILFHLCDFVYWTGWLRKIAEKERCRIKLFESGNLFLYHFSLCIILIFVFLTQIDISEMTSFKAAKSVLSGEARQWKNEMDVRQEIYWDSQIKDVTLSPLSVTPELLFVDDLAEDKDSFWNVKMAKWYEKDSIALQSSE